MLREEIEAAMDRVRSRLENLEAAYSEWHVLHTNYLAAIDKYEAAIASTEATEADIVAAKESAQQFLDSSMSAIGGLAGGMAVAP